MLFGQTDTKKTTTKVWNLNPPLWRIIFCINTRKPTKETKSNLRPLESYLLSGEEEENIPFIHLTHVDLDHRADGCLQVVPLGLGRVEDLDGMRASGDGQQWAAVKVHLELAGVERGTHHNHLEGQGHGEEREGGLWGDKSIHQSDEGKDKTKK